MENKLSFFRWILVIAIFICYGLYEVQFMYPKDPLIQIPFIHYILFALLLVFSFNKKIPECNNLFTPSFILLELFVFFILCEHSLFFKIDSYARYVSFITPLFLFLFSYNLTFYMKKDFVPMVSFVFVCIYFVIYLMHRQSTLAEMLNVDTGSYTVLYFLPLILSMKIKLFKFIGVLLIATASLLSVKRGGIMCFGFGLLFYMLIQIIQDDNLTKKTKKIFGLLFVSFVVLVGVYIINDYLDDFLMYRFSIISERGGSGRDKIYANVINMIRDSPFIDFLVGHGYNSVLRDNYLGFSAHNDFLEICYDFGFVSLLLFVMLFVGLVIMIKKMIMINSRYSPILTSSIVVLFINTMVSHIFLYEWHFMTFAIFWGYALASYEQETKKYE